MDKYKLKSFAEFKESCGNGLKISAKPYTKEEFHELMKPVMCNLCRNIFNPTDEEKEEAKKYLEELKKISLDDFTWEVIIKH